MLPTKFWFIGQAVSEEKIFFKSTNQKQELPMEAMFVNGSERKEHLLQRTFHRCFLPCFGSFDQVVLEEKNIFFKLTNQKEVLPVAAMFVYLHSPHYFVFLLYYFFLVFIICIFVSFPFTFRCFCFSLSVLFSFTISVKSVHSSVTVGHTVSSIIYTPCKR